MILIGDIESLWAALDNNYHDYGIWSALADALMEEGRNKDSECLQWLINKNRIPSKLKELGEVRYDWWPENKQWTAVLFNNYLPALISYIQYTKKTPNIWSKTKTPSALLKITIEFWRELDDAVIEDLKGWKPTI